ncbi:MAG: fasciclin domain-containing protein [Anaerolineae bacterium]
MRRLSIFIVIYTLLTVAISPTWAQSSGTIVDTITRQSQAGLEYTILQDFLDVTPAVRERLNSSGNYTFFAPNDTAFRNLEGAIDLSIADLLADVDVATALLNYHIVNGVLTAGQLRQRAGQVIETELSGAFIGIRVDDDEIVVNNLVEVVEEDIGASNGVIHQLNDVLLNRVINDLLDDTFHSTATPTTPTPEPTNTPTSTPEPARTASTANVRLAHFVSDLASIELILTEDSALSNDAYGQVSAYQFVPQGIYSARVIGTDAAGNVAFEQTLDLALLNGDFLTVAVTGSVAEDALQVETINTDYRSLANRDARVLIYHASPDISAVNIRLNDTLTIESLSYGEREQRDLDADVIQLEMSATRNADTVLLETQAQTLAPQTFYFIALFGTTSAPQITLIELTAEDMMRLRSGQSPEANDSEPTPTQADMRDGSIVDVLDNESEFSILLEAIQVADEAIINALGNPDSEPVTLLAPTNQAFINLLSAIGYNRTRLLADEAVLTDILLYHIIDERVFADDFISASGTSIITRLQPLQAFFVRVANDGRVFLNGTIEFERTDIQANNGVIHVVDDVLLPQAVLDALGL